MAVESTLTPRYTPWLTFQSEKPPVRRIGGCPETFAPMRFTLIDRIVELEPGARIKAIKALSMAEEYLGDHFPKFPVLPGVLMLEALTQAGAWLVRSSE